VWYICGCSVVSAEDIFGDFNVLRGDSICVW